MPLYYVDRFAATLTLLGLHVLSWSIDVVVLAFRHRCQSCRELKYRTSTTATVDSAQCLESTVCVCMTCVTNNTVLRCPGTTCTTVPQVHMPCRSTQRTIVLRSLYFCTPVLVPSTSSIVFPTSYVSRRRSSLRRALKPLLSTIELQQSS